MWVLKFYRDTLGNWTGNLDGWKGSVNMYSCVLLWEWNNGCVGDFVNASRNLLCIYPLNRQFHNSALWYHTAKRYKKKRVYFRVILQQKTGNTLVLHQNDCDKKHNGIILWAQKWINGIYSLWDDLQDFCAKNKVEYMLECYCL